MLLHRVLTAAVLIVILVPVVIYGRCAGVALLVAVFSGIALWELTSHLSSLKSGKARAITIALGPAVAFGFYALPPIAAISIAVWLPLVVLVIHLVLYHQIEDSILSASQMMLAVAYVAIPLSHATLLTRLDLGLAWVFLVLFVTCLCDTGAYFAGKYYGKHHFSASISPAKTVEGLLGGVAGGLVGMAVVNALVPDFPALWVLLVLTLLLSVVGPVGDLIASAIKRKLGIKDFGTTMPGHGGVLDRVDSLILAFPTTYYFVLFVGGSVPK